MPTREIRHPLIRHKLGLMRRADISTCLLYTSDAADD